MIRHFATCFEYLMWVFFVIGGLMFIFPEVFALVWLLYMVFIHPVPPGSHRPF